MKIGNKIKEMMAKRNNVGNSEKSGEDEENEGAEEFILLSGQDLQRMMDILAKKGFISTIRT